MIKVAGSQDKTHRHLTPPNSVQQNAFHSPFQAAVMINIETPTYTATKYDLSFPPWKRTWKRMSS